jgi:hypothetical protein
VSDQGKSYWDILHSSSIIGGANALSSIAHNHQKTYIGWVKQSYPVTESIHQKVLSFPISPVMSSIIANGAVVTRNPPKTQYLQVC